MTTWQDHLCALAALVADAAHALARDDDAVSAFPSSVSALVLPAGPLTPDDADLAAAVLVSLRRLTDELSTAQMRVGEQLHLHRRRPGRAPQATPVYLDSHA